MVCPLPFQYHGAAGLSSKPLDQWANHSRCPTANAFFFLGELVVVDPVVDHARFSTATFTGPKTVLISTDKAALRSVFAYNKDCIPDFRFARYESIGEACCQAPHCGVMVRG